jgi:hypothetical protein
VFFSFQPRTISSRQPMFLMWANLQSGCCCPLGKPPVLLCSFFEIVSTFLFYSETYIHSYSFRVVIFTIPWIHFSMSGSTVDSSGRVTFILSIYLFSLSLIFVVCIFPHFCRFLLIFSLMISHFFKVLSLLGFHNLCFLPCCRLVYNAHRYDYQCADDHLHEVLISR